MPKSYNGCPASPNADDIDVVRNWGITRDGHEMIWPGGIGQNDDLRDCFRYYVEQFFDRVEDPVDYRYNVAGFWGYEYRANVNNPSTLSCHASASAADTNAVRHPNGSRNTFTAAQYREIGKILDELDNVLIVGIPGFTTPNGKVGGWTSASRPDEMHAEAKNYDPASWKRAADKVRPLLGKKVDSTPVKPPKNTQTQDGSVTVAGVSVSDVQRLLNAAGAEPRLAVDNVMGPRTTAAIRQFQVHHGLRVDGIVGPLTYAALSKPVRKTLPYPLKGGQVFGVWNEYGWTDKTRSGDPRWDGQDIRNLIKTIQAVVGVKQDGIYGPATRAAVVAYQRKHGLTPDGLVGSDTWKKMFN